MRIPASLPFCTALATLPFASLGCGIAKGADARQVVAIDGSSTVFPLAEAVAESYGQRNKAKVTIGVSGTSGGFEKLCAGDVNVIGASRPIQAIEVEACAAKGIAYIELPIAMDGITVVVHPDNDWVDQLSVAELRRLWAPEAAKQIRTWRDLRPSFPDREIHLYAPGGAESGTYQTFTANVLGGGGTRGDFTASESDTLLVNGVASDRDALGIFGYAYYASHREALRAVPVAADGKAAVTPSPDTIRNGRYAPLSRPLFLYVNRRSADLPPVRSFVQYFLEHAGRLAADVGCVPLSSDTYRSVQRRFDRRRTGSLFAHQPTPTGHRIRELLDHDQQRQQ